MLHSARQLPDLHWIALTAAGFAAGIAAALALGEPIERLLPAALAATVFGMMVITIGSMCVAGAVLGASQWLELRRRLARPGWWIAATAFGLGFGISTGTAIVEHTGELIAGHPVRFVKLDVQMQLAALLVVGAVTGVFLGGAQALLLADTASQRRWILRSLAATIIGFPLSLLITRGLVGRVDSLFAFASFLVLSGGLVGVLTGAPVRRAAAA